MSHIEHQNLNLKPVPAAFKPKTEGQAVYLDYFKKGHSISETVKKLLSEGRLVSFTQMYDLIEQLNFHGLIQNSSVKDFFRKMAEHEKEKLQKVSMKDRVSGMFKKEKPEEYLRKHPFFRTQNQMIFDVFCKHAEVLDVPAGTALCEDKQLERDLFFVVEGEAAIYKKFQAGRKLMGFLGKDAVIGEVGFFMGELRTADVVCTKPSKIIAIRYNDEFKQLIDRDAAKNLTIRFRVVHALAKSPFLKNIPEEALDSLMYTGQLWQAKEFEILTKENDKGDSLFIVINGSIVITKGNKNIGVLGAGEAFGEIALFFTQGRRTATAMAQRDTTLLEIHATDFYGILAGNILLAREFEKLALERAHKLAG